MRVHLPSDWTEKQIADFMAKWNGMPGHSIWISDHRVPKPLKENLDDDDVAVAVFDY